MNTLHRARFAPSPSGTLHIGNLRSALMSFLCAKETKGSFILRIEDTDQTRTKTEFVEQIYHFLKLMHLIPDEGPEQGGDFGSYIQSERTEIYQKYLLIFQEKGLIYRCFQTEEELEERRKKQAELKLPPRYIKQTISKEEERTFLNQNKPFVWRLSIPKKNITIIDKVKHALTFDLAHFADVPLTRQDGSFTFLFANFVDDVAMKINYVIRGEEHLSNTAVQAYMYEALDIKLPIFYHLPLICDQTGKKLSKRNFGFNIQDLLNEGFLSEAIINYLIIIGSSFKEEIFSLQEAIDKKVFSETKASGMITYDYKKLLWVNKKWIQRLTNEDFLARIYSFDANLIYEEKTALAIKNEIHTLKEFSETIKSINNTFTEKESEALEKKFQELEEKIINFLKNTKEKFIEWKELKKILDDFSQEKKIEKTEIYRAFRYMLIRSYDGLSLALLCQSIGIENVIKKLKTCSYK
jgi:nondiscriminating glutamyl-tRNA synthetase